MSFSAGAARFGFDRSGWVTSVVHGRRPDLSYLSGAGIGALLVDDVALPPPRPDVQADVDELELTYTYPDRLRLVVRHSFATGWGVRLAFTGLADSRQLVERAELQLQPDPGCVAWALTLGVTGAYWLTPADGTAPLLGGVLRRGSVDAASTAGLQLSPFELRPGAQYVVQLQWDWYASPRAFRQERYPAAPSALWVTAGEVVQVQVDEDVAVLAPDEVEVTRSQDQLEATSEETGTFAFELRSARGTSAFELQWVAPVEESTAWLVPAALSRPRTAAGVPKLAGVAEALVVQHALAVHRVDDVEEAADALDLFTARLRDAAPLTSLDLSYLCREYDRLGEPDLLSEATLAVLGTSRACPGLGIAGTQLCVRLMVSGRPVDQVLAHLLRLVTATPPRVGAPLSEQAAELELMAVTHAGPGVAGAIPGSAGVLARIAALGTWLGSGLTGTPVTPLPVGELSHLIAVLQLLPDGLSAQLRGRWMCSAHALAHRATAELAARLDGQPIGEAHAWQVLALQPT